MTDRRVYDTREADDARSRSSWILGAGVLLTVGAAAAWWMLRASEPARPPDRPAAGARGGRTYLAAEHVDAESARLETKAGTTVVSLVLRDVKDEETVNAWWTDPGASDPGGPQVFLDVKKPEHDLGVLAVTSAAGKSPGERSVTVVLPKAVDRVTVIDLRWNGGRREGFEIAAPPASRPK